MIIRSEKVGNFTVMPNRMWQDEALSLDAKGMLGYLLSQRDDWRVHLGAMGRKLGIGKDKTQALVRQLIDAGYILRLKQKRNAAWQFVEWDYVVFDAPETCKAYLSEKGIEWPQPQNGATDSPGSENGSADNSQDQHEPQPEIQAAGISQENHCDISAAALKTVAGKSGCITKNNLNKSYRADSAFAIASAGGEPPSVSKHIWDEGRALLASQAPSTNPSIIGRWLKQVPTPEGKAKLLSIIRAAAAAGTGDPMAYITAALAKEYPPPPKPETFDAVRWQRNAQAAIKTKAWSDAWGPAPGKKGCKMPAELITPELTAALSARRIAL